MLMEAKKHIKLIFICIKYNLLRVMDNRVSFISQILGMILNNGIMIIQWVVLFSIKDNIGGYDFKEILLIWAFSASSYGIAHTLFHNAFNISRLIVTGKLDAFLVQPKDTLIYTSSSSINVSAIGDILYGIILLIIVKANFITWILFAFLSVTGGLILTSFSIICHSLSFWFINVDEFANVMNSYMINISTYPDGIFSKEIRWILLTIIPVSFVVHVPLKVVTTLSIPLFVITILFTVLLVIIAFIIFNKGLKRYSSSNLMSARI